MITKDDRTEEQRKSMRYMIVGRDDSMSGWGGASGGYSRAGWAFDPAVTNWAEVRDWVRKRGDMKYVHFVKIKDYRPKSTAHLHIYVWEKPGRRS